MDYLNKLRGLLANDALLLAEDIERQAAQGMVQVSAENGYAETVDPDTADPVLGEKTCQQCESAWVDASTGLVPPRRKARPAKKAPRAGERASVRMKESGSNVKGHCHEDRHLPKGLRPGDRRQGGRREKQTHDRSTKENPQVLKKRKAAAAAAAAAEDAITAVMSSPTSPAATPAQPSRGEGKRAAKKPATFNPQVDGANDKSRNARNNRKKKKR